MNFSSELGIDSSEPKYRRAARILRERILTGELSAGEKLPTEPELARMMGINHLTLRKGLALLAEQNLISQSQGRGTFVTFRKKRHLRVGILAHTPAYQDAYMMRLILMLSKVVCEQGVYELVLLPMDYIENLTKRSLLEVINNSKCDGIFLLATTDKLLKILDSKEFSHVNVVMCNIGNEIQTTAFRHSVDMVTGIRKGVEYLYSLGHRRIGYLGIESELYGFAAQRNEEFVSTLAALKLENKWMRLSGRKRLSVDSDEWYDDSRSAVKQLFTSCPPEERPTALIGINLSCSLGLWQGVMDLGLKIPNDVSVLGLDADMSHNPYFSAISQPLERIAEKALQLLFSMDIPGKHSKELRHGFEAAIIERGSCRAVP